MSFSPTDDLLAGPLLFDGVPFRRDEAPATGLTRRRIAALARSGVLRQIVRGVYLDSRVDDTLDVRAAAVGLVLPKGAALARRTAAWLYGVDARGPDGHLTIPEVECVVPVGTAIVRRPGLRCYVAPLEEDVVTLRGVRVTTPGRTAVDLLRWCPPHLGLGAVDALAAAGLVVPDQLVVEVERWERCRYVEKARRLAALVEPLTESQPESWLRLRMIDAGFPRPQVQIPLLRPDGSVRYRLDLGYPELMAAFEYDGLEFHTSREDRAHDEYRRDVIRRVFGWRLTVVGRGEVLGRSMRLEYAIGEILGMEPQIRRRQW